MLAILCSGQGHQGAGMFDLTRDAAAAAHLFAHAKPLLHGEDPRDLVRRASPAELSRNRTAQILCCLAAVTMQAALGDDLPKRRCVAGYSVGEVAAWCFAGLLEGEAALDLVAARAEAMDAARVGKQGLLFVRLASRALLEQLCAEFGVEIAIINPGGGAVIGGPSAALAQFAHAVRAQGADRVVELPVDVASHTSWMRGAAAAFSDALRRTPMPGRPSGNARLFAGVDGEAILDTAQGRLKLARQLTHTVRWDLCLASCAEAGADRWLETGPGAALSGMVAEGRTRSASEFRSLDGLRAWLSAAF